MLFALAFGVDKDIIEVYYHKNIELLCQDLVDIILERGQCVDQSKRHHLVLKMAIAGSESHYPSIVFSNPHLMVSISQIKLDEMSSPTELI